MKWKIKCKGEAVPVLN